MLLLNRRSDREPGKGVEEYVYEEADIGRNIVREGGWKVKCGQGVRFASLNVRSLWKATFQRQLVDYMRKKGIG